MSRPILAQLGFEEVCEIRILLDTFGELTARSGHVPGDSPWDMSEPGSRRSRSSASAAARRRLPCSGGKPFRPRSGNVM